MTRVLLGIAVLLTAAPLCSAGKVFIASSDADPSATGDVTLRPAESVDLFVWWGPDRDEVINGASIDIIASEPGIQQATSSKVFNPTIGPFGPVWNGVRDGETRSVESSRLVEGMLGVSVNAIGIGVMTDFGIGSVPPLVDGSYLFAEFTIEGVRPGETVVSTGPNPLNPITAEGLGAVDVDFAGIRVVVVPEPAAAPAMSLAVAAFTGFGFRVSRRTRGRTL